MKLKVVENQKYAFTTDSNVEPEKQVVEFEESLKRKFLNDSLQEISNRMSSVNPIPVEKAFKLAYSDSKFIFNNIIQSMTICLYTILYIHNISINF